MKLLTQYGLKVEKQTIIIMKGTDNE